jgi:asparagine N-glycosylation enzyme membrane subunit Stt3
MQLQNDVIRQYEHIFLLVVKMLLHAKNKQWDLLPAIEETYSKMISEIKEMELTQVLSEDEKKHKYVLLLSISRYHNEVSAIVNPQLRELYKALKRMERLNSLAKSYEASTSDSKSTFNANS